MIEGKAELCLAEKRMQKSEVLRWWVWQRRAVGLT